MITCPEVIESRFHRLATEQALPRCQHERAAGNYSPYPSPLRVPKREQVGVVPHGTESRDAGIDLEKEIILSAIGPWSILPTLPKDPASTSSCVACP
jgi:hypothetical protein